MGETEFHNEAHVIIDLWDCTSRWQWPWLAVSSGQGVFDRQYSHLPFLIVRIFACVWASLLIATYQGVVRELVVPTE